MSEDLHSLAGELFLAACALPPEERAAFVERACGGDEPLRVEVESLLCHHREDDPVDPDPTAEPRAERFRPAELFAGRYRILTLLGRGGMGEVYRAHDELLDQPVALKILIGRSAAAVDALLREVRLARSITHPSVCRVYDVNQADGEPFFTMELIEGEDLASLLQRAGRLSPDRVLDLARQLLTGLAAAHAKGVIHRDLKPSNVLIDRDGRAHITDFGIATSTARPTRSSAAGTPGYMAPEQWAGERADERTDLYSLALLLHEALIGRPVFAADRLTDLARLQTTLPPPPPSREVTGIEGDFERVLLQALEKDRALRPASALAMAAALPGGDSLAMALEAGVTPPVEVVAAAGPVGGMSRRLAVGLLLLLALALAAMLPLAEATHPVRAAGGMEDPAVLEDRAERLLADLGYATADGASDLGYLDAPATRSPETSLLFWFARYFDGWVPPFSAEERSDAQLLTVLDTEGHLVFLQVDPPASSAAIHRLARQEDGGFGALLAAADLDDAVLEPVAGRSPVPIYADERRAWTARRPGEAAGVRVDAASLDQRPVFFSLTPIVEEGEPGDSGDSGAAAIVVLMLVAFVLLPALPMAWRNARKGRGDRLGARRLVAFVVTMLALSWILGVGDRQSPFDTPALVFRDRSLQLVLHAAWVWVAYLGLEPLARRWWPESLIAWNRLLRGSWRDPYVGSSLLVGSLVGVGLALLGGLFALLQRQLGSEPPLRLTADGLNAALGLHRTMSAAFGLVPLAVYNGCAIVMQLVLVQFLLRRRRLAVPVFVALLTAGVALLGGGEWAAWGLGLGFSLAAAGTLIRFGLVAFCHAFWVQSFLVLLPLTGDFDTWFAGSGLLAVATVFSIGAAGCRIAISHPRRSPA